MTMFNGIIEELGVVSSAKDIGGGKELAISTGLAPSLEVDNSLCINGVCQTVIRQDQRSVTVQVVEETLRKTTLGGLKAGDEVNLERSLTLSQRIDGHIVQGHVDTTGTLLDIRKEGTNRLCTIGYDPEWRDLVVGRGSIAIDGISLTTAREAENAITVAIIPFTWDQTVFKHRKKGDRVNLEFDILGKYVVRFMRNRETGEDDSTSRLHPGKSSGLATGGKGSDRKKSTPPQQTGGVSRQLLKNSGFLK